jgi:glycosyltransferase involved in cell wall biosynthesis
MKSIDFICPVYCEQEVVGRFNDRLITAIECLSERYRTRVLYVLDPSPDRTEAVLREIAAQDARITILVMSRRFGHQAALIAGMDACEGDAAIMLDSDGQHPPELIPLIVERWENGADIVQTIRQDGIETAFAKRFTSRLFYRMLQKIGSFEPLPGAADYRLLSRRVLSVFHTQLREHNPFLRGLVSWVGFNISLVPFTPAARERGRSKYHISTLLNFALNGICSFSNLPLRFCIGTGFIIAGLSLTLAFLQVLFYFLGTHSVPGWASLMTWVSFIGGIQLMGLGILGEYVGLIFDEVKGRPRYIIDRVHEQGRLAAGEAPAASVTAAARKTLRESQLS